MNLYILSYNNYYNRIVKKEETLEDYQSFVIYGPVQGVYGFTPGDGVNTVQVLGSNVQMYDGQGDYLLAVDENNEIDSRWFIIDTKRERSGQWTLTLHRDLIVDYYDQLLNSPMFIEKATLNEEDPLIYNSENLEVNQIFTSQTLLKDETECPWFVGYYTKNAPNLSGTVSTNDMPSQVYETIEVPIENWEYVVNANETTPFKGQLLKAKYGTVYFGPTFTVETSLGYHRWSYDTVNDSFSDVNLVSGPDALLPETVNKNTYIEAYKNYGVNNINAILKNYYDYHTTEEFNDFIRFNGKLLKDSTGRYFEVSITPFGTDKTTLKDFAGSLFSAMSSIATSAGFSGTPTTDTFSVQVETQEYVLTYVERFDLSVNYNISQTNKLVTENEPYNIFAIPYGEITVIKEDSTSFTTTKQLAEQTVSSILGSFGGEGEGTYVYDVQLIGYCPVNYLITDNKEITLTDSRQYSLIQTGTEENPITKGVIFNVPSSSFTTNIPVNIRATDKKISSICDLYRLTAPDQSSYFDINIAKNDGSINYINIDVNLKPYNCYIHANPDFKGLYGQDFNTGRGLIYGSNLSLSRALNNFTEYQIQNSQFQNIFDRQIQNMEVQHKAQRIQDIVGGIAGTATGAAGGALAGSIIPGIGTTVGAIVGGVTSGIGGIADYGINEMLRNEALDYTKDMFGFNLANIKAQPLTLSKITALTQNNTIFIALDYYTCTEREREAVAHKIAYNSMTVMTIGQINDYINNSWEYNGIKSKGYIKGQLINLSGTNDDYHVIKSLANELYKGVYFKWE